MLITLALVRAVKPETSTKQNCDGPAHTIVPRFHYAAERGHSSRGHSSRGTRHEPDLVLGSPDSQPPHKAQRRPGLVDGADLVVDQSPGRTALRTAMSVRSVTCPRTSWARRSTQASGGEDHRAHRGQSLLQLRPAVKKATTTSALPALPSYRHVRW